MSSAAPAAPRLPELRDALSVRRRRLAPPTLALVTLVAMVAVGANLQPAILTVHGMTMMLMSAVPLVIAALAQMIIMAVGDIDLGVGALVGLVTVIAATWLATAPALGALALVGIVVLYALMAVAVQLRNVPSIITTLGMSFVWLGLGLMILPTPGGAVAPWQSALASWRPEGVPAPLVIIAVATAVVALVAHGSRFGVRLRALGSDARTLTRSGRSTLATRVGAYVLAAVLLIVAGLMLAGQTRTGDINSANNYALITIAAVILGGGTFAGGQAVPVGTAFGGMTLGLIGVLLSLMSLSSNLQSAAQGLIVLAVLAGRVLTERLTR
ncbi:ABC transporter permease [Georgenia thermotolerans]|uniref:ABC transporter permease n=1 Tax=Georgenia thermotolerans TaxID=527326 RepID=A0A7J5UUR0_9MICO|nr:ABC transporter permease [Georgenia thermotolerans]KAE8766013.1 ABC transporter permease [Georgenia thermotolerans]